jgi:hypothetical protein
MFYVTEPCDSSLFLERRPSKTPASAQHEELSIQCHLESERLGELLRSEIGQEGRLMQWVRSREASI